MMYWTWKCFESKNYAGGGSIPLFLVLQIGITKEYIPGNTASCASFRGDTVPSPRSLFIFTLRMLRVATVVLRLSPSGVGVSNHHFQAGSLVLFFNKGHLFWIILSLVYYIELVSHGFVEWVSEWPALYKICNQSLFYFSTLEWLQILVHLEN